MSLPFISRSPTSCGVVSSTIEVKPKAISTMFGLVPSSAFATINLSPLSVAEKVTVLPEPLAYLN